MPDFYPRMIDSGDGALLPLSFRVVKSVRHVGVSRVVLGIDYGPARVLAAVVCVCTIHWTCLDVVGWLPYDFTT